MKIDNKKELKIELKGLILASGGQKSFLEYNYLLI